MSGSASKRAALTSWVFGVPVMSEICPRSWETVGDSSRFSRIRSSCVGCIQRRCLRCPRVTYGEQGVGGAVATSSPKKIASTPWRGKSTKGENFCVMLSMLCHIRPIRQCTAWAAPARVRAAPALAGPARPTLSRGFNRGGYATQKSTPAGDELPPCLFAPEWTSTSPAWTCGQGYALTTSPPLRSTCPQGG